MYDTLHRDVLIGTHYYDALGNLALLKSLMLPVCCHSAWPYHTLVDYTIEVLQVGSCGVTLIGPFISRAEQEILYWTEQYGVNVIRLTHLSLTDDYRPQPDDQQRINHGRELLLAPWYTELPMPRTRELCLTLNRMAEAIAHTTRVDPYNPADREMTEALLRFLEPYPSAYQLRRRLLHPLRFRGEDGQYLYPEPQ